MDEFVEKELLKTGKDNIPVTKIVYLFNNKIISAFRIFEYKIDCLYELDDVISFYDLKGTGPGFHSYDTRIKIINRFPSIIDIEFDYHILQSYRESTSFKIAIADCIIPKGSKYFITGSGRYSSNKIKILNVYKIE